MYEAVIEAALGRSTFTIAAKIKNGQIVKATPYSAPPPDDVEAAIREGYRVIHVAPGGQNTAIVSMDGQPVCSVKLDGHKLGPMQFLLDNDQMLPFMGTHGTLLKMLNHPAAFEEMMDLNLDLWAVIKPLDS